MSCTGCKYTLRDFHRMDVEDLLTFLRRHNVILAEKICPKCGTKCKISQRRETIFSFRCNAVKTLAKPKQKKQKVPCGFGVTVRKNTFFEGSNFSIEDICEFIVCDTIRLIDDSAFVASQLKWSRASVVEWKSFLREVYVDWSINTSRPIIGGPTKTVEIKEVKVGHRKHNRGPFFEGQLVYEGIDRRSGEFFVVPVEAWNPETLLDVIKERIADGTTIMSNCWRKYNCLNDEGYIEQQVNHSQNFVDHAFQPIYKNVERLWRDNMPPYGRMEDHYVGYLAKFQFQNHFKDSRDRIHELFMAIGRLYDLSGESSVSNGVHIEQDSEADE